MLTRRATLIFPSAVSPWRKPGSAKRNTTKASMSTQSCVRWQGQKKWYVRAVKPCLPYARRTRLPRAVWLLLDAAHTSTSMLVLRNTRRFRPTRWDTCVLTSLLAPAPPHLGPQDVETLYENTAWTLEKKFGGPASSYDAFRLAVTENPAIFDELALEGELKEKVVANIKLRLTPQPVKIRSDIEVACYAYEGINAVKAALRAGLAHSTEDLPIKVTKHGSNAACFCSACLFHGCLVWLSTVDCALPDFAKSSATLGDTAASCLF